MEQVLIPVAVVVGLVVLIPLMLKLKRGYIEKSLAEYSKKNGVEVELVKVGIPPLRLWLKNRKGDSWALVRFPDGNDQWMRLRGRLFSGDSITFFDA